MADAESEVEDSYLIPTHLRQQDLYGPLPARSVHVEGAMALLTAGPLMISHHNPLLAAPALLAVLPFAWPVDPPAEHGLAHLGRFVVGRKRLRTAELEKHELARAKDGLVMSGTRKECRAILRVPTINMEVASEARKRLARKQWGSLLDTYGRPLQIVIPGRPASTLPFITKLRQNKERPEAWDLASFLGWQLHYEHLIERDRLVVVPGKDPDEVRANVKDLTAALAQIGLKPDLISQDEDLVQTLAYCWGARGNSTTGLPGEIRVHSDSLEVDGAWARAYVMGKLPPSVTTNWLARLIDGDVPADVALDMEPVGLDALKIRLGIKQNQLMASRQTAEVQVALRQITSLLMAFTLRSVLPYKLRVTLVVRGDGREELLDNARQLEQRVKHIGGRAKILRWEQLAGVRQVIPIRPLPLPQRDHLVETGTLARATPLAQATLQLSGGVPFGKAGAAPCSWTVWHRLNPNKHAGWFAHSGGGKTFSAETYLSREYLAHGRRVFGVDQDEHREWSGRFTMYLGGRAPKIERLADLDKFAYRPDDGCVMFDLHACRPDDLPEVLRTIRTLTKAHLLAYPAETFMVFDEAVRVAEAAPDVLAEVFTRWRHFRVSGQALTQRVSDWFDTAVGRRVQGSCSTRWYGGQEPEEIEDVAKKARWSKEERDKIDGAGIGQGLLITAGKRVWVDLFQQISTTEFATFNTDADERARDDPVGAVGARAVNKPATSTKRWKVYRQGEEVA